MIILGIVTTFGFGVLFGIIWSQYATKKKCKKCHSRNLLHDVYTSGWNNRCNQASGDEGDMCRDCGHVDFRYSFTIRQLIAEKYSPWVTINR